MTERRRSHTPAAIHRVWPASSHAELKRSLHRGDARSRIPGRLTLKPFLIPRQERTARTPEFPEKQVVSQRVPVRYRQLKLSRPAWHSLLDEKASVCTTAKKQRREFLPELNSEPEWIEATDRWGRLHGSMWCCLLVWPTNSGLTGKYESYNSGPWRESKGLPVHEF